MDEMSVGFLVVDQIIFILMVILAGFLVVYFIRYINRQRFYWWTGHPETSFREERVPSSDESEERKTESS